MKKRFFAIIICLFAVICSFNSYAENEVYSRLVDQAELLSETEQVKILKKLDEISLEYEADVVIVTVEDLKSYTAEQFADDFFDYGGYGLGEDKSGVLLLISTDDREWYISGSGFCVDAFDSNTIEDIGDEITDDLADGNYADAFTTFADECEYYLNGHINGFPFNIGKSIIISLAIGLVIALITTLYMKGQLKSVKPQNTAGNYVKDGSMSVNVARDFFIYRHISRIRKPQNNNNHRSSSGRTHSGGGGRF